MDVETAIRTRRTHKAYRPEPVDARDPRRALRARPLGAEPPPDQSLALPRRRPAGARAPEAGRRARGRGEARPRADARRRARCVLDRRPGRRTRRTCTRPASPPTSSCSPPTPAGSPATGARPASCASRPGREAVGIGERRALRRPAPPGRARPGASRRPSAPATLRRSPTSTDLGGDARMLESTRDALRGADRRAASTSS